MIADAIIYSVNDVPFSPWNAIEDEEKTDQAADSHADLERLIWLSLHIDDSHAFETVLSCVYNHQWRN